MSTPKVMDLETAWIIIYSTVVGWQMHPGNKQPNTMEECAIIADLALEEYRKRRGDLWQRG